VHVPDGGNPDRLHRSVDIRPGAGQSGQYHRLFAKPDNAEAVTAAASHGRSLVD
jgi:hypothetical protein